MRFERSLFRRLQVLSASAERDQTEDFFSEALVGLFEHQPSICRAWLNSLDVDFRIPDEAELTIATQVRYPELETTSHPRRPDIRIRSDGPDGSHSVVLIESKHEATEGGNQLRDYAHVLSRRHGSADHCLLLYVTTRYEDKRRADVLDADTEDTVEFHHTRWHHFYRFLSAGSVGPCRDYYQRNILRFMEELGMATANQFQPEDIITLRRLRGTVSLMDEVLGGRVANEFYRLLGTTNYRPDQLLVKGRYVLKKKCRHVEVVLGFYLHGPQQYPTLALIVVVRGRSKGETRIFDDMDQLLPATAWESRRLDDRKAWSGIIQERSIRTFLDKADHVHAMQEHCMDLLGTIEGLKGAYPHWFGEKESA